MTRNLRLALLIAAISTLAAIYGYFFAQRQTEALPPAESAPTADAAGHLLSLTLPDLSGQPQALSQWKGKVLVANFWATWCPPCKEEMPEFSRISIEHADNGVQFVGISVDSAEKVAAFQKEIAVSYPLLVAKLEIMDLAADLGNRPKGLPFTVVLRPDGQMQQAKLGKFAAADLEKAIQSALQPH